MTNYSPQEHRLYHALVQRHGAIVALGFRWETQQWVGTLKRFCLDFAFTAEDGRKLCVEVDGHAFHNLTKEQALSDRVRDRVLMMEGWRVIRFAGEEIHTNADRCADEIIQHLKLLSGKEIDRNLIEQIARAVIRLTKKSEENVLKRKCRHDPRCSTLEQHNITARREVKARLEEAERFQAEARDAAIDRYNDLMRR